MQSQSVTMTAIRPHPEFARIALDEQPFAVAGRANLANRLNGRFDRLVIQAGIEMAPSLCLWLCACSSLVWGLALFVMFEDGLWTATGLTFGGVLPICWLDARRTRRRGQILAQLPEFVDRLTRLLRSGRTLTESLRVAATEESALGAEISRCVSRLRFSLPMAEAMSDLPIRTGVEETHQLVAVAALHQRTGANPLPVLEELSSRLREQDLEDDGRRDATRWLRLLAVLVVVVPWVVTAGVAAFAHQPLDLQSWRAWWIIGSAVALQVVGFVSFMRWQRGQEMH